MSSRVVLSYEDGIVQEVQLSKPVTVVGRHPDCDLVIDDAAVSGRHMLFRVVNRTVYVEDLASTNGTRVNGLTAIHQVVHHLDTIEVGRHKMHFFEESMLAGRVNGLESTVLTDFERTMIADHVPDPAPAPARRRDDDLSKTLAMPRDSSVALAPDKPRAEKAANGAGLALRVLRGDLCGHTIPLDRANTMIGDTARQTALVVRRGDAYYLARFAGQHPPRLNRKELGPGTHLLCARDVIDVGGMSFEVVPAG